MIDYGEGGKGKLTKLKRFKLSSLLKNSARPSLHHRRTEVYRTPFIQKIYN